MTAPSLFDWQPTQPFQGKTYNPSKDLTRLLTQQERVRNLMEDGQWRTVPEIKTELKLGSETGIAARLRGLRAPEHGSREVQSQRVAGGLWEYRMLPLKNTTLIGEA